MSRKATDHAKKRGEVFSNTWNGSPGEIRTHAKHNLGKFLPVNLGGNPTPHCKTEEKTINSRRFIEKQNYSQQVLLSGIKSVNKLLRAEAHLNSLSFGGTQIFGLILTKTPLPPRALCSAKTLPMITLNAVVWGAQRRCFGCLASMLRQMYVRCGDRSSFCRRGPLS